MPDLKSFQVTVVGVVVGTTIPRFRFEAVICDDDGVVVADLTGAAALYFPDVLGTMSAEQIAALAGGDFATRVLLMMAGVSG